jgi:hypothetical protein
MRDIVITELSDKVIIIQAEMHRLLNDEQRRLVANEFEKHGFKVIWLSL